ncbi:MAG: DUF3854 domain-containing protein [Moorellales bacterium]
MRVPVGDLQPVAGGREYRGRCPACGDPDHMYFNPSKGRSGVWYCHKCGAGGAGLPEGPAAGRFARAEAEPSEESGPPADPDRLHRAYSALLEALGLSSGHLEHLLRRGFPEELIAEKGYRTLPAGGRHELAARVAEACDPAGVPGFFQGQRGWCLAGPPGILVPFRDFEGRIVGIQVRRDSAGNGPKYVWLSSGGRPGGAGARAAMHVAGWRDRPPRVWVTEGGLKADYCAWRLGEPFLAVPGVGLWRRVGLVAELVNRGADRVVLAYDADWRTKRPVRRALAQLAGVLRLAGFDVTFAVWPPEAGKGLDDLLAAGGRPELKSGGDGMVRVIAVGRVNARPQLTQRKVKGQVMDWCRLVLVVHQNGQKQVLSISCWGRLARQAAELAPGQLVEVEARLNPTQIQAASGDMVPVVTVNAWDIEPLPDRSGGAAG